MTAEQVAAGMAAFGVPVAPPAVAAFEAGTNAPGERELAALSGALWCDRADLMGRSMVLREHRLQQGLSLEDAATVLGVSPDSYREMENANRLQAPQRRVTQLAHALRLPVRATVDVSGNAEQLRGLLQEAVEGWWKGQVKPVNALVPLPKSVVQQALRRLHTEYQQVGAGTTNWSMIFGEGEESSVAQGAQAWVNEILERFWRAVDASSDDA